MKSHGGAMSCLSKTWTPNPEMVRLTSSRCITHSPDVMQHRHGWIPSILLDGPIITEEELTCLPLIKVVPDGQYTGAKLNSVVRMMRGLLEQKVPLQEFDVRMAFNLQNLSAVFSAFYHHLFFLFLAEPSESGASG